MKTETPIELGQREIVQNKLEKLLKEVILPHHDFEIAHRWSGIMCIGKNKNLLFPNYRKTCIAE